MMVTLDSVKTTFERLLVPTDFSDVSERALDYAKSIAKQYGSQILLTHVSQPINPIAPPEAMWIDEQAIQQQIEERLEQRGAELRSEGVQAKTIATIGMVETEILSTASKEKADLIVLGTQGRTGLDRLLFGSDAEALLRHADCPVLIIGPATQPIGDQIWRPGNVLCASDLDPNTATIAVYADMLAHEFQATFTLFRVKHPIKKGDDNDLRQFEKAVTQVFPKAGLPLRTLHTLVSDRDPGLEIVAYAKERHTGLIVMGARTAFTGTSHLRRGIAPHVVAEAPCPVMLLHQQ